ncbi:hypothetical protein [Hymenobacter chitinivorans]|uniref:SH3 domain-containing protein n=1 Tax=Hymenobacter chitinivorans DSM 11115 TaxID=1121954 RepID=A0A2M9BPK4_9BACT|nr:hypothetical protein [Hymenobacter chitinivorans]PJJ59863.1 hypothetical protein CLV45_1285 [Hymenobacter chitinivorans DSM 11115]
MTIGAAVLLALSLTACADDSARRPDSELRVDPPAAASTGGRDAADAPPSPTAGRRYRVRAEAAYFYASPGQSKPTGQYLRRGDVLFGQDEGNGFVRTQFVNPAGATVTGWLKTEEVSRLAGAAAAARPVPAPRRTPSVAAPAEAQGTSGADPTEAGSARTAVVRVARSYFYNSPDLLAPRRAYCEQGDKVRLGQEQGQAVYVSFTNWEKVTTRGWMKKEALRFGE